MALHILTTGLRQLYSCHSTFISDI